ncbi:sigma-70 family RNA polymerase sigma factor [Aggregatibacter kilianii]|uniref:sigma-70 family RNA polymerase sigma factor n=1 Tax=Aggregatibacter kilianii TaxID=2025884 RepID=UPI000D64817C|nr:sigma-70 family RNA polymerase sigma factor [Aggregatibacter kilianii]RDE86496.1 RNA polymerase subunit sigma [Aggregatibacter aphrophilus]
MQFSFKNISSQQIQTIRQQMLKFAVLQLRDEDLAEDVVQEALTKAYQHADSFKGAAALKTWFFAILKNQIIDLINYRRRTLTVSEVYDGDEDEDPNVFFDQTGHWDRNNFLPTTWQEPSEQLYKKEFWIIFEACLEHLPAQQARVFMMREYFEMKSEQICQECDLSTSNLHVLLYRARLQLQACLTRNWFDNKK